MEKRKQPKEAEASLDDPRTKEDKARPQPPDYKDTKRTVGRGPGATPVRESSRARTKRKPTIH